MSMKLVSEVMTGGLYHRSVPGGPRRVVLDDDAMDYGASQSVQDFSLASNPVILLRASVS